MDDYQKLFGRRVRELRKEMKFSQERLAGIAGLDRSYYGGIERGTRNPSLRNICEIAKALGVAPADLFPRKPVRLSRDDGDTSEAGPKEKDLLWGYGDGVCVGAVSWIDEHLLTPLHERSVRGGRSSRSSRRTRPRPA
jgi:transcriptional regulator with XRE-family HTH domain